MGVGQSVISLPPLSNGQKNRVNQDLEQIIWRLASSNPSAWAEQLICVEYAHNTLWHLSLYMSPFLESVWVYSPHILRRLTYGSRWQNSLSSTAIWHGKKSQMPSTPPRLPRNGMMIRDSGPPTGLDNGSGFLPWTCPSIWSPRRWLHAI